MFLCQWLDKRFYKTVCVVVKLAFWKSLLIFGDLWQYFAIFGNLLRSFAIFGDLWQSLAIFGKYWNDRKCIEINVNGLKYLLMLFVLFFVFFSSENSGNLYLDRGIGIRVKRNRVSWFYSQNKLRFIFWTRTNDQSAFDIQAL